MAVHNLGRALRRLSAATESATTETLTARTGERHYKYRARACIGASDCGPWAESAAIDLGFPKVLAVTSDETGTSPPTAPIRSAGRPWGMRIITRYRKKETAEAGAHQRK